VTTGRVKFITAVATTAVAAGLAAFFTFAVISVFTDPDPSSSLLMSFARAHAEPAVQAVAAR
jgi:hypothetical protein